MFCLACLLELESMICLRSLYIYDFEFFIQLLFLFLLVCDNSFDISAIYHSLSASFYSTRCLQSSLYTVYLPVDVLLLVM